MSIDPAWARWYRQRSSYNPSFPGFMSPVEIYRYRADATRQGAEIAAGIEARRRERADREASEALAAGAAAINNSIYPFSHTAAQLLLYYIGDEA